MSRSRPRPARTPPLDGFHPAVAGWFARTWPAPTEPQARAWPAIAAGHHVLVAAPTGSGKTLTAFLAALDALVRQGLSAEGLPDETRVLYVSPLKALSNDVRANLEQPLAGIRAELASLGLPDVDIRSAVRTGDTPPAERARHLRKPPHVLVTTPESLYVLLGSAKGRALLGTVRTVIVDEIHAVAPSKRGSHLALSLERLDALLPAPAQRIGLSATQKPVDEVARFLVGAAHEAGTVEIVDIGYAQARDLALELPEQPLGPVLSHDQFAQVHGRIAELALLHRTTLVFVNTRRMAERMARHLGERLGREQVAAHHGSLARELRLDAEQRLKRGELKLLVATASLELGLDIGDVDLVCQLGSPRAIATFLQRAGRAGHHVGGVPKARLFPQTRDELVECAALLDAVRRGELDALRLPVAPLDVLAQHVVAEVACRDVGEDDLYALVRRAWPYRDLARTAFEAVVAMLAEGYTARLGARAGRIHRDAVHGRLRGKAGSRLAALTSGGTIPDVGDYQVQLEPQAISIGSVNEDFAIESIVGDVFQLGNASYRVLKIEPGRVRVEDAQGAAPNIPFWLGEAPGRSDELSVAVSRLRDDVAAAIDAGGIAGARRHLSAEVGLGAEAAAQVVEHLAKTLQALGVLPTRERIVLERFFDESGGMQLVIHAPFGSRLNRAWGLALRKRFCRRFNFELQAAATEEAIVLSLSTSHSFPLDEVARYLHSATARDVLVQAVLDAPLFAVRFRWNASTALALPRLSGGRKVAPQLQRMKSEDLLAAVFPDQVACAENLAGDREVPDHPLVAQTLVDCLEAAMDAPGWLALLARMEAGAVEVVARDVTAPSSFAVEALTARPYAFLDDAPLEERRTQAVQRSRSLGDAARLDDAEAGGALGALDAEAIALVQQGAWPTPRNDDEMHEALVGASVFTDDEVAVRPSWRPWLEALAAAGRATRVRAGDGITRWVAAERLAAWQALHDGATCEPVLVLTAALQRVGDESDGDPGDGDPGEGGEGGDSSAAALAVLLRARLGVSGPVTATRLADALGLPLDRVGAGLVALQTEGSVLVGHYTPAARAAGGEAEWCERHLLARIHRHTLQRLRREIEPVPPRDFVRFLFEWQRVGAAHAVRGPESLAAVLAQLEGYEAPAAVWESALLPARVADYQPVWLDELCASGRIAWSRLRPEADARGGGDAAGDGSHGPRGHAPATLRTTPLVLMPRRALAPWAEAAAAAASTASTASMAPTAPTASTARQVDRGANPSPDHLDPRARRVMDVLTRHGASFFDDLLTGARLLPAELEDALATLAARGLVACDSYAGLRALLVPPSRRPKASARRGRGGDWFGIADAGRWSRVAPPAGDGDAADRLLPVERRKANDERLEHIARALLRRWGVVCWHLLEREARWLPPWRDLVRTYRRLEARGEIRGGRFIDGLSGEQFAWPDAVASLRRVRRTPGDGALVCVAAADPVNLLGAVIRVPRVPRVPGARVVWRDGVPLAAQNGTEILWCIDLPTRDRAAVERVLAGGAPVIPNATIAAIGDRPYP